MTGNEIREAEEEIKNEISYYSACRRDRDPWLTRKLLVLIIISAMLAIPKLAYSVEFMCPHCETDIELTVQMTMSDRGWPFPDTWTCSQCGYENYEGINSCAMCGGGK